MSKYVLVNVIDREIYVYPYDNLEEAWDRLSKEYHEFCEDNNVDMEYDSNISYTWYSAWANGSYGCADWQIRKID